MENRARNINFLILLGCINNLAYCVVTTSAKSLAESFNQKALIGAIPFCLVFAGIFSSSLNAFFCSGVKYRFRNIAISSIGCVGLLLLALVTKISFWVVLLILMVLGGICSFGE